MMAQKCITKYIHYWFITMVEDTSHNNNTHIGGTIYGSSTAPSLGSLTNDTFLEKASLIIAQKTTVWRHLFQWQMERRVWMRSDEVEKVN